MLNRALISAPWYLDLISYGRDWVYYYNVCDLIFLICFTHRF